MCLVGCGSRIITIIMWFLFTIPKVPQGKGNQKADVSTIAFLHVQSSGIA